MKHFGYILFIDIFVVIADMYMYSLNVEIKHGYILSNILLNNYTHMFTPRSLREASQKVPKLSLKS